MGLSFGKDTQMNEDRYAASPRTGDPEGADPDESTLAKVLEDAAIGDAPNQFDGGAASTAEGQTTSRGDRPAQSEDRTIDEAF